MTSFGRSRPVGLTLVPRPGFTNISACLVECCPDTECVGITFDEVGNSGCVKLMDGGGIQNVMIDPSVDTEIAAPGIAVYVKSQALGEIPTGNVNIESF